MSDLALSRERRIDWRRLIDNLQRVGVSIQDVAEWLGVGKSTLRGYINEDVSSEPQHWIGHCLITLWCEKCNADVADVPTVVVDARPKRELLRQALMRGERITASLEQMAFAWFGAAAEPGAPQEPHAPWLTRSIRFRIGIARTPWDQRPFGAFVVYDEPTERRVQGSSEFVEWRGDWQEFAPS